MHGWINDTLEKFILAALGPDILQHTREKCGFQDQIWEQLTEYPDETTFALVFATCEIAKMEPPAVIEAFGAFFIQNFRQEGFTNLLRCQGATLRTWLAGVNDLHSHIKGTVCDKLIFPEIWCTDDFSAHTDEDVSGDEGNISGAEESSLKSVEDDSFVLNYMSMRGGGPLAFLVVGITKDAAKYYFGQTISMDLLETQGVNGAEATTWRVQITDRTEIPAEIKNGGMCEEDEEVSCPFSGVNFKVPNQAWGGGKHTHPSSHRAEVEMHRGGGHKLTTHELSDLFPFFVTFDETFTVTDCGAQIRKRIRHVVGSPLFMTMDIVHPALLHTWRWTDLERCQMGTFELRPKAMDWSRQAPTLSLRGGLYMKKDHVTGEKTGTFIVSPAVSSYDEMVQHGLSMDTDIPRHSVQRRLIMLNEHIRTESSKAQSRQNTEKLTQDFDRCGIEANSPLSNSSGILRSEVLSGTSDDVSELSSPSPRVRQITTDEFV